MLANPSEAIGPSLGFVTEVTQMGGRNGGDVYHHFRDILQNFLDVSRRNNEKHLTQVASTHLKNMLAN